MNFSELITDVKDKKLITEGIVQKNGRYYAISSKGKPLGLKSGYATMKEAVRTFYMNTISTFEYINPERQEFLVNNYMKKKMLGKK